MEHQLFYSQHQELGQLSLGTRGLSSWDCLRLSYLFIAAVFADVVSINKQDLKLPSSCVSCVLIDQNPLG